MKLSTWLAQSNTSQTALSRRLGISQGRISQIIAGETPSFDLAMKISKATAGRVQPGDFQQDDDMTTKLDSVDAAIKAIAEGQMVVVVDDDDRENEGDLICAAARMQPEQMAFMVRHTSGIVCTPMPAEEARRLKLDPMVALNDAPMGTAFTVSIDYREGLTTGISAKERTATVHALANRNVQAEDFVRPGHIFPLVAKAGGVLMRSGHTEAAVDLVRLAGFTPPVGVICELVNDDGSVKRGPQVLEFARAHKLAIISVNDLIAYRQQRERLVEQTGRFPVETPAGLAQGISYRSRYDDVEQLALVFGDITQGTDIAVRLHRENVLEDVFGRRETLAACFEIFRRKGQGVLVYLQEGSAGVPASQLAAGKPDSARERSQNWLEVGLGAQILRDLGVRSIELISSSNRHYVGLAGFGIEIAGLLKPEGQ
jgi:3,4-dihydroxy 2-butanone 4-phosphate synthase/GTP cyclohydrolase II